MALVGLLYLLLRVRDESDSALRDLAEALGSLLHDMGSGLARRQLTSKGYGWLHQARALDKRLS